MVDTKIRGSEVNPEAAINQHAKLAMGVGILPSSPSPSSKSMGSKGGQVAKPAAKNY